MGRRIAGGKTGPIKKSENSFFLTPRFLSSFCKHFQTFSSKKKMRQTCMISFGTKFVVKYWHAEHENRTRYPEHGALYPFYIGLAFPAVTIAVSEPFLLQAAENWYRVTG